MDIIDENKVGPHEIHEEPPLIPHPERREAVEEISRENRIIRNQLDKEVLKMKERPELEEIALAEAAKIKQLDTEGRLKRLIGVAADRGALMAVRVCKEMNDPYLLDLLHDTLAANGYYQSLSR